MQTTRDSRPEMLQQVVQFFRSSGGRMPRLIHSSHNPVGHPGFRPGTDPLCEAFAQACPAERAPTTALALTDHTGAVCGETQSYAASVGVENIPLPAVLNAVPAFKSAWVNDPQLRGQPLAEIMRLYGEAVHFGAYLASHDKAFLHLFGHDQGTLKEWCDRIFSKEAIRAANLVECAVAEYVHVRARGGALVVHDDWPPSRAIKTMSGLRVTPHIMSCHGVIPQLESVLAYPQKLRKYQLELFESLASAGLVTCVHTGADANRLRAIADYLHIPERCRAEVVVRRMVPSCYLEVDPSQPCTPIDLLAPLIREGKRLAVCVERLDPIKMDFCLFEGLRILLEKARDCARLRNLVDSYRLVFIGQPVRFPEAWSMAALYREYYAKVRSKIREINNVYHSHSGTGEDFVVVIEDTAGEFQGLSRDELRAGVFPFVDIAIQTGQEGLCLSVQEPVLLGALLRQPRVVLQLISSTVGFSEKTRDNNLLNALVVGDAADSEQYAEVMEQAMRLSMLQSRTEYSLWRERALASIRSYYAGLGSSYYEALLPAVLKRLSSPLRKSAGKPAMAGWRRSLPGAGRISRPVAGERRSSRL